MVKATVRAGSVRKVTAMIPKLAGVATADPSPAKARMTHRGIRPLRRGISEIPDLGEVADRNDSGHDIEDGIDRHAQEEEDLPAVHIGKSAGEEETTGHRCISAQIKMN